MNKIGGGFMDKEIESQLNKLRVPYEVRGTNDEEIFIPCSRNRIMLEQDKCYLVALDDIVLNPPPEVTLHTNWNNGNVPKYKCYKMEVTKIMGNMIKINGVGYDLDTNTTIPYVWSGWIPNDMIKVLSKLD